MLVGDGARIQGSVFRLQPCDDKGIGSTESGTQILATVELGTPTCSVALAVRH